MILMQSAITTITKQDTNAATMAVVAETVTSKYGYNIRRSGDHIPACFFPLKICSGGQY